MQFKKFKSRFRLFLVPALLTLMILSCSFSARSTPTLVPALLTALPTALPTPAFLLADSMQIPNGPILGDKNETQTAIDEKLQTLGGAAIEQYPFDITNGEKRQYTIQVGPADQRFMWTTGWCTIQDAKVMTANLEKIKFDLTVNGQPVDLNSAVTNLYNIGDQLCKMYYIVVYGWPDGTTILEDKTTILETINDGYQENYPSETVKKYQIVRSQNALISPNSASAGDGKFTFQYPSDLVKSVKMESVEARLNSMVPSPAFTTYQLDGYPLSDDLLSGLGSGARIQVFSAAEFSKMSPITGEVVEMLKALKPGEVPQQLENRSSIDPRLIPFPPVVTGNTQIFYSHFRTIDFQGGRGYAYITQYQFEPGLEPKIQKSGLTYVFVGLGDNDVLIVGLFPLSAPSLTLPDSFTMEQLQSLQADDFKPNLDVLDTLLKSINVKP